MSKTNYSTLLSADRRVWRQAAVAVSLALLLTACGYRLSGDGESKGRLFDPVLKTVSLQGMKRYDPLRTHIKNHLRSYGIRLRSQQQAAAHIVVVSSSTRQKDLVIGDYARTREKLLILTITFNVKNKESGRYMLDNQTVRVEDTYLYDSLSPSRNDNERKRLLNHLYQRASEQIVFRLATIHEKTQRQSDE